MDRGRELEVVRQVDGRRVDLVDAVRADRIGQEPGDVDDERTVVPAGGHRARITSGQAPPARPVAAPASRPHSRCRPRRRPRRPELGTSTVEQGDALLDAAQGVGDVALEPHQHADRVLVRAAADLVGRDVGLIDDAPALGLGGLGQPTLVDQERGLLLGPPDHPLGLFLGFLDDPLALGVDALGGTDLFGDGDPQFVDEAERGVLVDHDVGRQRQLLAVRDQRLEALDEEDDVDRSALQRGPAGRRPLRASVRAIMARAGAVSVPSGSGEGAPAGRSPRRPAASPTRRRRTRRSP